MILEIHSDGGARGNPGPAAGAFLITTDGGRLLARRGIYLGVETNNQAEYLAVMNALIWVQDYLDKYPGTTSEIHCTLDSELVVNQLSGQYRVKSPELRILTSQIKELERSLAVPVRYQHVKRTQNKMADKVVNEILDRFSRHI